MTPRQLDQFYTAIPVAQRCYDIVLSKYSLDDFDFILEPCAGTGSFYSLFPAEKRIGMDIDPKIPGIETMNFLLFIPDLSKKIHSNNQSTLW